MDTNDILFIVGCTLFVLGLTMTIMSIFMAASRYLKSANKPDFLEEFYKDEFDAN